MGIISLIQMNYFMYGHYKSDTNELFYIGIGKRRKGAFHSQIYARAYQCSSWLRCFSNIKSWEVKYDL